MTRRCPHGFLLELAPKLCQGCMGELPKEKGYYQRNPVKRKYGGLMAACKYCGLRIEKAKARVGSRSYEYICGNHEAAARRS